MRLLIVIVNYRTADLAIACLPRWRRRFRRACAPSSPTIFLATIRLAHRRGHPRKWLGLGDAPAAGAQRRIRLRQRRRHPSGAGLDQSARFCPAAQPGHRTQTRRRAGADGFHGNASPGRHRGQPIGRPRRHAPAIGVSISFDPQRIRARHPPGRREQTARVKMVAPPVPEQPVQIDWVAGASMMIRRRFSSM